jgi:hypothetical protein
MSITAFSSTISHIETVGNVPVPHLSVPAPTPLLIAAAVADEDVAELNLGEKKKKKKKKVVLEVAVRTPAVRCIPSFTQVLNTITRKFGWSKTDGVRSTHADNSF